MMPLFVEQSVADILTKRCGTLGFAMEKHAFVQFAPTNLRLIPAVALLHAAHLTTALFI
jgi:hypothetical protein